VHSWRFQSDDWNRRGKLKSAVDLIVGGECRRLITRLKEATTIDVSRAGAPNKIAMAGDGKQDDDVKKSSRFYDKKDVVNDCDHADSENECVCLEDCRFAGSAVPGQSVSASGKYPANDSEIKHHRQTMLRSMRANPGPFDEECIRLINVKFIGKYGNADRILLFTL